MLASDFIELLIGFVEGDEECVKAMADAYTKSKPLWKNDEWLYVKDIEMNLKEIFKIHQQGNFDNFKSVKRFILNEEDTIDSISDSWVRDKLRDCRSSLSHIHLVDL